MDPRENSDSDSDMRVDETSNTPMEVNNTQDSSVERTGRGAIQCKRITKMREGELLNVQYYEDGQRIGEGGKDLASYSGEFDFDGEEEFGLEFDEEYEVGVSSVSHKSSELPLECLSVSGLGVGIMGLGWLWRSCTKLKRLELRSREGIGDVPMKSRALPGLRRKGLHLPSPRFITCSRLFEKCSNKDNIAKAEVLLELEWRARVGAMDSNCYLYICIPCMEISKLNSQRRAAKEYNHRTGKTGFADIGEQLDVLTKEVEEGKVVIEGSKDILTLALGTPEHPRVALGRLERDHPHHIFPC
ncbi:hypothetical protein IFM89_005969 [Coptis chinensis]|uniref:Uncharacterized protein n=1 Tax=Coptis chinensis TaxID=261450 RepID=A0A835LQK0_9MAGN|nr:hypothetical protein IFM89_005969 [Coptis chinensis]